MPQVMQDHIFDGHVVFRLVISCSTNTRLLLVMQRCKTRKTWRGGKAAMYEEDEFKHLVSQAQLVPDTGIAAKELYIAVADMLLSPTTILPIDSSTLHKKVRPAALGPHTTRQTYCVWHQQVYPVVMAPTGDAPTRALHPSWSWVCSPPIWLATAGATAAAVYLTSYHLHHCITLYCITASADIMHHHRSPPVISAGHPSCHTTHPPSPGYPPHPPFPCHPTHFHHPPHSPLPPLPPQLAKLNRRGKYMELLDSLGQVNIDWVLVRMAQQAYIELAHFELDQRLRLTVVAAARPMLCQ
jgi:hypothetical protein